MIEHVGESTKLALSYARRASINAGADAIEPEHLFLGIGDLDDAAIRETFTGSGVDLAAVCTRLRARLPRNPLLLASELAPSAATEAVLTAAAELARQLGQDLVEAPLVCAGILAAEGGLVAVVLRELGGDPGRTRDALVALVESGRSTPGQHYRRRRAIEQSPAAVTPVLDTVGRDLTEAADNAELSPVIGRDDEIDEVVAILLGQHKSSALLVGDAGVGKTAIVEGLAQRISRHEIPELDDMRVRTVEVGSLVAGTVYRGQFEQRLKDLVDEVRGRDDVILFIDEMHMLVGAGETGQGGSVDAANMLKPVLSQGNLKVIGATTFDEYRKYLEPDRALMRRFQQVVVGEPSRAEAVAILAGIRPEYEGFHEVRILDEAIDASVDLSVRHLHERRLPDKAIDLLDRACTAKRIHRREAGADAAPDTVGAADVAAVVAEMLDIPVGRLSVDERAYLGGMADALRQRVIGQDAAVDAVAATILRARSGVLRALNRPYGVFLFLGPTGVGKTMLARELAAFLFGSAEELVELDMGQYQSPGSISELIGAPRGYVSAEQGGALTNAVRKKPYSVIVLDELEKADPAVWNLFLPVFDTGLCQDALGRTIDFRNTVIIATSNVGARRFGKQFTVGFGSTQTSVLDAVRDDASETFPPELLNRFDEVVVFDPLTIDSVRTIVRHELVEMITVPLDVADDAVELLAQESFDPAMGARPVRRTIQRLVANPLAVMVAAGEVTDGDRVRVDVRDGALAFEKTPGAERPLP